MTDSADDAVAIGIAAWARLRDREKTTWADWLDVARALAVGRTVALKAAATNKCVGSGYNAAMCFDSKNPARATNARRWTFLYFD